MIFFGSIDFPAACGLVMREFLSAGSADWTAVFQFWYDGQMYEFAESVGPSTMTPAEAGAEAERRQLRRTAWYELLDELELEVQH